LRGVGPLAGAGALALSAFAFPASAQSPSTDPAPSAPTSDSSPQTAPGGLAPPDAAAAQPSNEAPAPAEAPVYPSIVPQTQPVPASDVKERPASPKRPLLQAHASAEAGGLWSQGLDATDAATRQGGFYAGGSYSINEQLKLFGRYTFASGTVVERLSGTRFDTFGEPNDVRTLQSRHALDLSVGYLLATGLAQQRVWALPFLGPRLLVLDDSVAPRTAFDAELGARVGIWSGDSFEASAFFAWAPALAKTKNPGDIYGRVLAEMRFGVATAIAFAGPFGFTVGYEGDVVTLAYQRLSYHQALTGLTYAFE
jgi:hypothetical protein